MFEIFVFIGVSSALMGTLFFVLPAIDNAKRAALNKNSARRLTSPVPERNSGVQQAV